MSWKVKAAALAVTMSSWFGVSQAKSQQTKQSEQKKEIVEKTKTLTTQDSVNTATFKDSVKNSKDAKAAALNDSIRRAENLIKFRSVEHDMLGLVAHCEGVKAKAYWDPNGKVWTIGFGNTIRPDGKPVTRYDFIKSEKELFDYFRIHIEGKMYEDMEKYLPMDKMSNAELVAMGSFLYNCGSGVLRKKNGELSEFGQTAVDYFTTHSDTAKTKLAKLMDKKVTAKGKVLPQLVKRRELEKRILFGDIVICNDNSQTGENVLNLSEISLGGIYSIGSTIPKDTALLCDKLESVRGLNLNDSIQNQMRLRPQPIYNKKFSTRNLVQMKRGKHK